ncbi:MAG: SufD family Fe-S cluster assembly protein [Candidatus Micrarchaeales archaeon]
MKYSTIIEKLEKEWASLPKEPDPLYTRSSLSIDFAGMANAESMDKLKRRGGEIGYFDVITNGKEIYFANKTNSIEAYNVDDEIDYNFITKDLSSYIAFAKINAGKILFVKALEGQSIKARLMIGGYVQIIISAEKGSDVAVEEVAYGKEVGAINEINAHENSKVKLDILQESRKMLSFYSGVAGKGSSIVVNSLFANGDVKSSNSILCHEGSKAYINNVVLAYRGNVDVADYIVNLKANGEAFIVAKAIGKDSTILIKENSRIEKDASESKADIVAKGLNMGNSKIEVIPAMTANENNIKASHSAGVAPLSKEAVEYLMSRGIRITNAKKLMLKGFVSENANAFSAKEIADSFIEIALSRILGE